MAIVFTVSEHGTKSALRTLAPNKMKRIRNKGVNKAADIMLEVLQGNSRNLTGAYEGAWRKAGSGPEERSIINNISYAKYVTGVRQRTKFVPQGQAGAFFMRKMRRENTAKLRSIILGVIRDEFAG